MTLEYNCAQVETFGLLGSRAGGGGVTFHEHMLSQPVLPMNTVPNWGRTSVKVGVATKEATAR
jgi:hypothetical protein